MNNPLVTGPPHIRFYAGVQIATEGGYKIGALCINDTEPRKFSADDIARLQRFGQAVEGLVESPPSRSAAAAARDAAEKAQILWKRNRLLRQVERIGKIGGWELDLDSQVVEWSDEVSRIHELAMGDLCPLEQALGFYPHDWRAVVRQNIATTIATGEPYDFEAEFVTASGRRNGYGPPASANTRARSRPVCSACFKTSQARRRRPKDCGGRSISTI